VSQPAALPRLVATQAAAEARLTLRRSENLLAMVVLPAAALWVLGSLVPGGRSLESALPGVLALALVASGLVNLAIATGYERGYGVLKRLGGSPLGRDGLLAAKLGVVGVIASIQVVALIGLATVMGWRPGPGGWSVVAVLVALLVGSATFASIGLLLAGTLRPEATLVVANVLFLVALVLGGVLVPVPDLPATLETVAVLSPIGALAEAFRAALGAGGDYLTSLAVVAIWGIMAAVGAIRLFRWD